MARSRKLDTQKLIAAIASSGKMKTQICRELGYSDTWIASMLKDERISPSADVALARYFGYNGSFMADKTEPAKEKEEKTAIELDEVIRRLQEHNEALERQNEILERQNRMLENTMKSMNGGFVAIENRMAGMKANIDTQTAAIISQTQALNKALNKTLNQIGNIILGMRDILKQEVSR